MSHVQKKFNDLDDILDGIYNLKEFSPKTYENISGFGELLSYYIIGKLAQYKGFDVLIKDSREILTTNLLNLALIKLITN